jgi:hypothetical protein
MVNGTMSFIPLISCKCYLLTEPYLKDVLSRLPHMTNRQIPNVTPEVWGKTRKTVHRQAAS